MAQYKVPQDVEADDKLIGPFTFRQFIYLIIMFGIVALCVVFIRIGIWPLCILFIPPFILLGALALPIKKDQPMETYLSAVVSFYLKPRKRTWEPGQPNSTIKISAPKIVEENRTKDLSQEEASRRLSFLADIVDTEGYAIKGSTPNSALREEVYAEASVTQDIFENNRSVDLGQVIQNNDEQYHQQLINQMRNAIDNIHNEQMQNATIERFDQTPQNFQLSQTPNAQPEQYAAPMQQPEVQAVPEINQMMADPVAQMPDYVMPAPQDQLPYQPPTLPQPTNYETNYYDVPQQQFYPQQAYPQQVYPDQVYQQYYPQPVPQPIQQEQTQPMPQLMPQPEPIEQTQAAQAQVEPEPTYQEENNPLNSDVVITPDNYIAKDNNPFAPKPKKEESEEEQTPSQDLIDLANNPDFSIETIAKQAKRVNEKNNNNGEVYISLH